MYVCDMTLHFNVYLPLSKWKMDLVIYVYTFFLNKEMTQQHITFAIFHL